MVKIKPHQYIWVFIAGCYAGYLVETIWCLIRIGHIESRKSLVLGHLSVAYGMGAVLLTLLLVHFIGKPMWEIFLVSFVSGTVVEYICSLGQEIVFGSVAWDYSDVPLNINGRVCLLYSVFWGLLGIAWVKLAIPLMTKIFNNVRIPFEKVILCAFVVFFIFDSILSASAALRMNEREQGIAPKNRYESFLDKHYGDEKMHEIYANSEKVKK